MILDDYHIEIIKKMPIANRFPLVPEPERSRYINILLEISELNKVVCVGSQVQVGLESAEYFSIRGEILSAQGESAARAMQLSENTLKDARKELARCITNERNKLSFLEQLNRYAAGDTTALTKTKEIV